MPKPNSRIDDIIRFHNTGFRRLQERWAEVRHTMRQANQEGSFLTFLSYEIHSNADGDYTIVNRDLQGEIVYASGIRALKERLHALSTGSQDFLAIPHHIGYLHGFRGLNWETFTPDFSPVIELFSMHGCSEDGETARPFLHSMGPADWQGTMRYGLQEGNIFGVIGGTDHHSAHPGSHGHGRAAVWARSLTRRSLWEALLQRRTYAVTGDRIELEFSVNGRPMGSLLPFTELMFLEGTVSAGGPIDYVDIVKDGTLLRRYSAPDQPPDRSEPGEGLHTKLALEVGWGRKGRRCEWEVSIRVPQADILGIEPRFRGREVLSPTDETGSESSYYESHWERTGEDTVFFRTATYGNPNTHTAGTQGLCLEVKIPADAIVEVVINGAKTRIPVQRLVQGPKVGYVFDEPSSPAWKIDRLPRYDEFKRRFRFQDSAGSIAKQGYYYLRVRQKNGQWAWSSPVFVTIH
jgi:hypothetical protein